MPKLYIQPIIRLKLLASIAFMTIATNSLGQDTSSRFQFMAQAAYLVVSANDQGYMHGPAAKLTIGDRVARKVFLNLSYEFAALGNQAHSLSLSPQFVTGRFLAGIDISVTGTQKRLFDRPTEWVTKRFRAGIGIGAHIGLYHKISKHVSLTEQFGARLAHFAGTNEHRIKGFTPHT